MQPPQQRQAIHSGKIGIDHQAGLPPGPKGRQKCLARRKILYLSAVVFQHGADRLADTVIVINDEDHRRTRTARHFGRTRRPRLNRRMRQRQQALDGSGQLFQLHRLAELHAALKRDAAQRAGRYIAGQDDRRDRAMQCFARSSRVARTPSMPFGRL